MRRQAIRILVMLVAGGILNNDPAGAESVRAQSTYRVEFGKKLLADGKAQAAGQEFITALYLDPAYPAAKEQLELVIKNHPTELLKLSLQQQFFIELADYVHFLQDRLVSLIAENHSILGRISPPSGGAVGADDKGTGFESKIRVLQRESDNLVPALPDADAGLVDLVDLLSQRKVRLLALVREAQALNDELQSSQTNFIRSQTRRTQGDRAQRLIEHIKDLQLSVARKEEIVTQQAKNITLLNEEINELRMQFAGMQKKFEGAQQRIDELTKNLAGSALEVYQRDARLAVKESELVNLRNEFSELRERSDLMHRIIQEKELKNIAQTEGQNNSTRIQALEQQFAELNQKYTALEQRLAQKEGEVARLGQEIELREAKIANLRNAFLNNERQVDELLGVVEIYKSKLGETMKVLDGVDIRLQHFDNERREEDRDLRGYSPLPTPIETGNFKNFKPTLPLDSTTSVGLDEVLQQLSGDLQAIEHE